LKRQNARWIFTVLWQRHDVSPGNSTYEAFMSRILVILAALVMVGCSQSLYTQGGKLVDQGKYDKAVEMFYNEIQANPKSAHAWRELGVAFYKKGDLEQAEEALKRANSIRPDVRTSLYIGLTYEKQENYGKAIDAYRASLSLKPRGDAKNTIQARLDLLISRRIKEEVSRALEHEGDIDVQTIPENTVGVVDFDNTHLPPELAPIGKGLAEFTAIDLAKVHSLRVVDRLKINMILDELKLSSSQYADPAFAPRVGRLLGSHHIITGSVLGIGDDAIRLDGALVNTRDSSAEMTDPTEGAVVKFFKVQKDFVFKVVDKLGVTLTAEERDAIEKVPTESYLSFLAYCRGLDYKSRGMFTEAHREFQHASQEDKGFAEAQAQAEALSYAPTAAMEEAGSFERFESQMTSQSDEDLLSDGLDRFQASTVINSGFITDLGALDRFGNTPDSPTRRTDKNGTVIIRGNLDVVQ